MNDQVLSKYADFVDEAILEKYLCYEEKIKAPARFFTLHRLKIASVAACIGIFILSGIFAIVLLYFDAAPSDNDSFFTLKAYAANGEIEELSLYEACLNSGGTGKNIFGVDFPVFSFYITLLDENDNKMTFFDVDISVSYGGKDVTHSKDKHVFIGYTLPSQGSNEPYGFVVTGWFEDPTDITIIITDAETGDMLEKITLNVCYSDELKGYELTVTEITTSKDESMDIKSMLLEMSVEEISIVYGRTGIKESQSINDKEKIIEIIALFLDDVYVSSDKQVVDSFMTYCFGAYPDKYLSVNFVSESGSEICFLIYGEAKMMILMENQVVYVCNTKFSIDYDLLREKLN